jgi:hypothetical protein
VTGRRAPGKTGPRETVHREIGPTATVRNAGLGKIGLPATVRRAARGRTAPRRTDPLAIARRVGLGKTGRLVTGRHDPGKTAHRGTGHPADPGRTWARGRQAITREGHGRTDLQVAGHRSAGRRGARTTSRNHLR